MDQYRLTEKEIQAVFNLGDNQRLANAATRKALREVARWLEEFPSSFPPGSEEVFAIERGRSLVMAVSALRAILAEEIPG